MSKLLFGALYLALLIIAGYGAHIGANWFFDHRAEKKMSVGQLLRTGKVIPGSHIVFKDGSSVRVLNPYVTGDGGATMVCDSRTTKGRLSSIRLDSPQLDGARIVPLKEAWHMGLTECPAKDKGSPKRRSFFFN